ncbi:MAG TPA: protein-L-isoaspartate(D-aspartate) O-methyltransferase [Blastocatellia bacterium]|nr:protein-L-isoaspartate(D-aspartate) O-methyltransferase [Blastocatellia bacterium]
MKPNGLPELPSAALYQPQRTRMIELLRRRGILDESLLRAMAEIPRHLFVPEALAAKAYGDHALPIGYMQTISQPYMVARMTQLLELNPESNVLEIGAGSGYQTAVLSRVAGRVFAIERIPELARSAQANIRRLGCYNATVKAFDGTAGWSQDAPYDAILVAAGSPDVPAPLLTQLGLDGKLVIPVGSQQDQILVRLVKTAAGIARQEFDPCSFVRLIGRHGWPDGPASN